MFGKAFHFVDSFFCFLSRMFSDTKGNPSSMRFLCAFVVVDFMTVWTIVSLRTDSLAPISFDQCGLIASAMLGKAVQSFAENRPVHKVRNTVVETPQTFIAGGGM